MPMLFYLFYSVPITLMVAEAANGVAEDLGTFGFLHSVDVFGPGNPKLYGVEPNVGVSSEAKAVVAAVAAIHYPSTHAIMLMT